MKNPEEAKKVRLSGQAAIEFAEQHGALLSKFEDPTEGHRDDVEPSEANHITDEDPDLIYIDLSSDDPRLMNDFETWTERTGRPRASEQGVYDGRWYMLCAACGYRLSARTETLCERALADHHTLNHV